MLASRLAAAAALLCAALAAHAQPRIGVLSFTEITSEWREGFRRALDAEGLVEGKDIVLEWRSAAGHTDRIAGLARELLALKVDIIVTRLTPAAHAAKEATKTIPIVMAGAGDPVGTGLVSNLARPGENITGIAGLAAALSGKRMELLREVLPGIKRVGLLINSSDPFARPFIDESRRAAHKLGISVDLADVRRPDDVPHALAALRNAGAQAVIVQGVLVDPDWRAAQLALEYRLPSLSFVRPFAESGGLMNAATSVSETQERAASYVARILKGAKPGELPVEQPSRFEFTINLRTAKALNLRIPRSVLLRADELIE